MSSPAERIAGAFTAWNRRFPSAGTLALASFLLAVLTGIPLATGYDVTRAGDSLSLLQLTSRSGRWLRALHAWSSHAFIVLTLLHATEHLASEGDRDVPPGPWQRLALALPLLLGLPLTGFMLKGDAEADLARMVMEGLLEQLPLVGPSLSVALLGAGDDLQNVYLHHAATLTLVVAAVAVEHGRRLWPGARALSGALAAVALLSLLWPPGLHADVDEVVLGPWYFVGLQEALRWLPEPGWVWLPILAGIVSALLVLPHLADKPRRTLLRVLAAGLACYALLDLAALAYRSWPRSSVQRTRTSAGPPPLPSNGAPGQPSELRETCGHREG